MSWTSDKSLRTRLDRVKRAIDDASWEARRYAQIETPKTTPLVAPFDDTHLWTSFLPRRNVQDTSSCCDNEESKLKSNASLELGMILFGESVPLVEEEIVTRLTRVEMDLEDIVTSFQHFHEVQVNQTSSTSTEPEMQLNPEILDQEILELRHKVDFLKAASEIRLLLDQAADASLGISKRMPSDSLLNENSSYLDGMDTSTSKSSTHSLELKSTAQLVETIKLLEQAQQLLLNMEHCFFPPSKSSTSSSSLFSESNHELCYYIFESLAAPIRRRRLDLFTKVQYILDSCIGMDTNSIRVQDNEELLMDAWDALSLLSQQQKGSQKLQEYISTLAKNLRTVILQPLLSSCLKVKDSSLLLTKNTTWMITEKLIPMDTNLLSSHHRGYPSISGSTCILEWSTTSSPLDSNSSQAVVSKAILHSFHSLIQVLSTIFKFIYEKMLCRKKDLSELLGSNLLGIRTNDTNGQSNQESDNFDKLMDEIISHMDESGKSMIQVIPSLKTMIRDFCLPDLLDTSTLSILPILAESLGKCTSDFETSLVDQGFVKETDTLSEMAIHFEEYVAEKRRAILLSQGRNLLLKMDYHNSIHVGTDVPAKKRLHRKEYALALATKKFDFEDDGMIECILQKAAISQVAEKLLAMVRQTMDSAVDPLYTKSTSLSVRLPFTLYRTARELLDLFRFLIPTLYKKEIGLVPRTTALFYNDCVFLAHHCLTLGLEYNDRMVQDLKDSSKEISDLRHHCTFVDLVPLFREMGDRYLVQLIQFHKGQLIELVGSRLTHFSDALGSNDSVVEWNDAESAQSAGLFHIKSVSNVWKNFLSWDVYGRVMAYLADAMVGLFLDKIFHATDISEEACTFTNQVFDIMSRGILDLFMDEGKSLEEAEKDTSIYCHHWDRLNAVASFLNMTLVDITLGLSEGVFSSITGPELSSLVVAVFQDSEKRRSLLKLLQNENV